MLEPELDEEPEFEVGSEAAKSVAVSVAVLWPLGFVVEDCGGP